MEINLYFCKHEQIRIMVYCQIRIMSNNQI